MLAVLDNILTGLMFDADPPMKISVKLIDRDTKKPIANMKVLFYLTDIKLYEAKSDALGNIRFSHADLYANDELVVEIPEQNGYKGDTLAMFLVDSVNNILIQMEKKKL